MNESPHTVSKVPEVTLIFWVMKIAATTLGETVGDAVSMSMKLGYLVGTGIFAALFGAVVVVQIKARRLHPTLYWATIIATTTVGTTMADFADRSLGIGYAGGSVVLLGLLLGSMAVWYRAMGSVSVDAVSSPQVETLLGHHHLSGGAALCRIPGGRQASFSHRLCARPARRALGRITP